MFCERGFFTIFYSSKKVNKKSYIQAMKCSHKVKSFSPFYLRLQVRFLQIHIIYMKML